MPAQFTYNISGVIKSKTYPVLYIGTICLPSGKLVPVRWSAYGECICNMQFSAAYNLTQAQLNEYNTLHA